LVIFEIRSCFMPRPAWTKILLLMFLTIAGMTGVYHNTQLEVEMGVSWTFYPGWPGTTVFLILAFVADMTSKHHHAQLLLEMGVSWTFLPRLVSNHKPPKARITGTSQWCLALLQIFLLVIYSTSFFFILNFSNLCNPWL
jgi:disulfide bond formation protein DsbB